MKVSLKILIILLQLTIVTYSHAQNPDTIIARAYYSYEHILDTTEKEKIFKEDMLLALGKNASVFTSLSKIYQTRSLEQQASEQTTSASSTGDYFPVIKYTASRYTTSTEYYKFNAEKKLYIKENLIRDYLYEDDFPEIDWQITNDTASFKGILCQKAITKFKGRHWIAWFTTELPFQSGPWLLGGLPGLILEAKDTKNQIAFHFNGFEKSSGEGEPLESFKNKLVDFTKSKTILLPVERTKLNAVIVVRATKKEILKLREAMSSNLAVFRSAQMEATRGIDYNYEATRALKFRPKINNPIELSDK
jgi:GLPGLI family protein